MITWVICIIVLMAIVAGYSVHKAFRLEGKRRKMIGGPIDDWATDAQKLIAEVKAENAKYDEEGYRIEYDAHYARCLEIEQGLRGMLTQCDDTNCQECYWKARMLNNYDTEDFRPGSDLLKRRQEAIKGFPDGLSDELYELLWEDWVREVRSDIEAAWKARSARQAAKEQKEMEDFYCTPYAQIVEYMAEGRIYDAEGNYWK